jgi:hypothetical protein
LQRAARFPAAKREMLIGKSDPSPINSFALAHDVRWLQAKRVASGPHFCKSPLLSRFLLFVVARTLEGRQDEVTERQIGVQVFGRPGNYRTVEDNIVRNYARQLRKRLADHWMHEGYNDSMRIEIPLGGYVPEFVSVETGARSRPLNSSSIPELVESDRISSKDAGTHNISRSRFYRALAYAALLVAYSVALICVTRFLDSNSRSQSTAHDAESVLWNLIFDPSRSTYIVPPDAGLNLLEDLSHHPLSLSDYIRNRYLEMPLPKIDAHGAEDIRTQRFTGFANLQIVAAMAQRPEYNPGRVFLRFPRDLRFDDLKSANTVILGSACSNPWATAAEQGTNFQIRCGDDMQSSTILNRKPQGGELASYVSHWNEPMHETYALIAFVPNLGGNGHMLLLEGLDVAGTQAAAEALLHSAAVQRILEQARRPNGSLATFEILLRATSIQSNGTGTEVIASRID